MSNPNYRCNFNYLTPQDEAFDLNNYFHNESNFKNSHLKKKRKLGKFRLDH